MSMPYHHQRRIRRRRHTSRREIDDCGFFEKVIGSLEFLSVGEEFLVAHGGGTPDLRVDCADVSDGLDDVARAGLTLGTDEGSALRDAAQSLAQVLGAAHVGNLEVVLVDVVQLIGRSQDLRLINVVDSDCFEDLVGVEKWE
ncbi:hypothetical protein BC936DRAFT_145728 [Jimgerdemannia flammicorona]|uniref:Uncharacterized protein n=1 Tax=Jimgerdemannia flammicorona TaxID=994334 RepID=A0A433D996_9FUNG|nr:hypothetical protein BC936DRAFT_145728 [Jimgerdemannia flammicorona]